MIQINNGMLIFGGDDEVVIQEATAILSTIIKKYELTEEEIEEMVDAATSYDFEIHEHTNDTLKTRILLRMLRPSWMERIVTAVI